jgi:hypothetical protein
MVGAPSVCVCVVRGGCSDDDVASCEKADCSRCDEFASHHTTTKVVNSEE